MQSEGSYVLISSNENEQNTRKYCIPITIEPAVLLFFTGVTLSLSVTTDLILVYTCEDSLYFNNTFCQELGDKSLNNSQMLESGMQHKATNYILLKSLVDTVFPAVLSFYLGPWSDKNGRKPLIMWPMLGYTLTYMILMVESMFPKVPVVALVISGLPAALSGGVVCFISGMYSYVSDISTPEKRTEKLGMVQAALFGGLLVSSMSVPYIYAAAGQWGYSAVYATSVACCFLAWIYSYVFVHESVVNDEENYPYCCLTSNLFKNQYASEMIVTCCKGRSNNAREIILILFLVLACSSATLQGENAVIFLFTREKFGWNLDKYSIFSATSWTINIFGLLVIVHILEPRIHSSPAMLTAIALFTKFTGSIILALSPHSWYMYLGAFVGLPGACIGPWCRSILSMSVPKEDLGKVFAFAASLESLAPIVSVSAYTLIYNESIGMFPGLFFIISAVIFVVDLLLLIRVQILQRCNNDQYMHLSINETGNVQEELQQNI